MTDHGESPRPRCGEFLPIENWQSPVSVDTLWTLTAWVPVIEATSN
jgi:hypothetical protein